MARTARAPATFVRVAILVCTLGVATMVRSGSPEMNYLLYCGGCHLADGSGIPPEIPDLREDMVDLAQLDQGRSYLLRVPGASQADLTDAELAAVMNWMFDRFYGAGHGVQPYDAKEVGRERGALLIDPLAVRKALLEDR